MLRCIVSCHEFRQIYFSGTGVRFLPSFILYVVVVCQWFSVNMSLVADSPLLLPPNGQGYVFNLVGILFFLSVRPTDRPTDRPSVCLTVCLHDWLSICPSACVVAWGMILNILGEIPDHNMDTGFVFYFSAMGGVGVGNLSLLAPLRKNYERIFMNTSR